MLQQFPPFLSTRRLFFFSSGNALVVDLLDFLRSSSLSLCIASILDLDLLAVARKFQTLII